MSARQADAGTRVCYVNTREHARSRLTSVRCSKEIIERHLGTDPATVFPETIPDDTTLGFVL